MNEQQPPAYRLKILKYISRINTRYSQICDIPIDQLHSQLNMIHYTELQSLCTLDAYPVYIKSFEIMNHDFILVDANLNYRLADVDYNYTTYDLITHSIYIKRINNSFSFSFLKFW